MGQGRPVEVHDIYGFGRALYGAFHIGVPVLLHRRIDVCEIPSRFLGIDRIVLVAHAWAKFSGSPVPHLQDGLPIRHGIGKEGEPIDMLPELLVGVARARQLGALLIGRGASTQPQDEDQD